MRSVQFAQSFICPKLRIALRQRNAAGLLVSLATLCFVSAQCAFGELAFQQLHKLSADSPNPKFPICKLVETIDGSFYGTSAYGGDNDLGTVFKITNTGELTTLHSFDGTFGVHPNAGLTLGVDGDFYGTTIEDGLHDYGKVFRINSSGMLTPVVAFYYTNGAGPRGQLVQGGDGCLYGATESGGAQGLGTIFKVATNGALSTLFSFNGTNGANPFSGLVQGTAGDYYGTTAYGGSNFAGVFSGHGTVFKITTNGVLTTLVYFTGTNGLRPYAGLTLGSDGNFYGTTQVGGVFNKGTVFEMTASGQLNTLVSFDGTNGLAPFSGVTQGADGKLYGVTAYGTVNTNAAFGSVGTIYSVTTNGVLAILTRFDGTNAQNPFAELTLAHDGNLYGVTGDVARNLSLDGNAGLFFRLAQVPMIASLTRTNSDMKLTWTSFTSGTYRVEYNPSLATANWTNLAPDATATGDVTSFTNAAGNDSQGYYRVRLLP